VGINKNFVVKNGFEVSNDLILANADTRKVGIASTNPQFTLDVAGGIGATDFYLTGIGTFVDELNVGLGGTVLTVLGLGNSIGIGTALPAYLLDIRSPVLEGQTALYVQGDVEITGDIRADDIIFDDAEIEDLIVTDTLFVVGLSTFNSNVFINAALNVAGLSTLGGYVDINDSVDIAVDLNVVGLTTLNSYVTINDSVDIADDLNVSGIATLATVDINAGEIDASRIETGDLSVTGIATIATISVVGAELSNLNVTGIGTIATADINAGEIDVTRIETVDLSITGITTLGTIEINSGIITATSGIVTYYGDGTYLDLSNNASTGIGIGTTGGVVGYGITFIDFYGAGVSTTFYDGSVGIATIFFEGGGGGSGTIGIGTEFPIDAANGDLFFNAVYARLFVYYDENIIGVGTDEYWIDAAPFNIGLLDIGDLSVTNLTVTNNANILGIVTASAFFGDGSGLTGVGIGSTGSIDTVGIITASAFFGDGSGLTGAGSTVFNDTTTDQEFFPLFTDITTGTITSSGISTSKLTYNPSTGEATAINFNSTSDINLKENIHTVENALETISALRGVSFDWKETGKSSYGVIAQEIEEFLPELVKQGEVKSVNYNGIIGVLIEAVKELKKEIEDLKKL
jgi:hypothetical protein